MSTFGTDVAQIATYSATIRIPFRFIRWSSSGGLEVSSSTAAYSTVHTLYRMKSISQINMIYSPPKSAILME